MSTDRTDQLSAQAGDEVAEAVGRGEITVNEANRLIDRAWGMDEADGLGMTDTCVCGDVLDEHDEGCEVEGCPCIRAAVTEHTGETT